MALTRNIMPLNVDIRKVITATVTTHQQILIPFVILLLIGAGVRLMLYERYLPFQDYTDESVYQVTALHRRGIEDNSFVEWRYGSLPPAYIWLTMFMQQAVETGRPWTLLADYLHAQRLLAVFAGIVTITIVSSIGWQIGGRIAAWFAGLIWALSPLIAEHNSLAIPDPFVFLAISLAITMMIRSWKTGSPHWLTGALLAGIVAIYLKYNPVYILIPWGITALVLLRRDPRRTLPWLILQLSIGILTAWYLMVNYAALDLPAREMDTFGSEGLEMALTPWRNFNNWWSSTRPIGEGLFLGTMMIAFGAYVYSHKRRWQTVDLHWYGVFLIYAVFGLLMVSSFTNVWEGHADNKIRHVLPITIALLGLWSGGIAQIFWTLEKLIKDFRSSMWLRWLPKGLIVGLTLILTIPAISDAFGTAQQFQRKDTRQILWEWTDDNVPDDGRIMTRDGDSLSRTWNRWWSGYDGYTPFDWWHEVHVPQNTPTEYVERGIFYFAITENNLTSGYNGDNPEVKAFVSQLVPLKTIHNNVPGVVGATIHFYRMLPPLVQANAIFGERIILAGYDIQTDRPQAGSIFTLRPYWRISDHPESNYSLFVHLYPADEDRVIAQYDGPPAHINRPTLTWDDLEEFYIGSDAKIDLPADLPAGDYRLAIGLYDYLTGERLLLPDGKSYFSIDLEVQES